MNNLLVRYRHWFLGISLVLAAVCALLTFRVTINSDMTKYLPDQSNMRAGIELMTDEFGDMTEMNSAGIRVLCDNLTDKERIDLTVSFRNIDEVNSVTVQENGTHTLYELGVSNEVNQLTLGKKIAEQHPQVSAVETSQDGSTAEAPMLLGGIALLLVILFSMCRSWLEPVLFLASTGIAVLFNVGTNALLPSVSVTTHSIASVLQLVLSIDYSIILINRFRQERLLANSSEVAMQNALRKAAPSILSSTFTTIVGLLMLVFMKLKIGTDLGIVLSKGVFCSLICNFTVLPSLILLFEKGIERSLKPVLKMPTKKLANFSMRFRIPLTVIFIALFVASFILQRQTNIIFHNDQESKIEQFFPKKNPIVLIYDNADEQKVLSLMDSISASPGVEMVISYPTLLQREYTAPQMVEAIADLTRIMAGMNPDEVPSVGADMLSDDVLKLVYYAAHDGGHNLTMGFNEMADFVIQQANNPNSLIAKQIDGEFQTQLNMLDDLRNPHAPTQKPANTKQEPQNVISDPLATDVKKPSVEFTSKVTEQPVRTLVTMNENTSKNKSTYTDTALLNKPMTATEMAAYLNMEVAQAKSVYKLARRSGTTMTPLAFVHFITEEVLQRKALAMMIKETQKKELLALQNTMDSTMREVFIQRTNESTSNTVDIAPQNPTPNITATPPTATTTKTRDTIVKPDTPKVSTPKERQQEEALDLLDEMLYGNHKYTAHEMAHNISLIGEEISEPMINLLYLYYGGNNYYNNHWTMSLEEMVDFLADTLLADPRFESFIDEAMRTGFGNMKHALTDGVGKLKSTNHALAMIITNYPTESAETYAFIDHYNELCDKELQHTFYSIGESVMLSEMKHGFGKELSMVTLLTIAAIFLIVAISFRSVLISLLLVMSVMTGVYVNVMVSGLGGGSLLYIAYLIVQSILMGAAIDYGILFANYYRENRKRTDIYNALKNTYRNSIHTILTSGLILILVPGIMAVLVKDPTISDIVRSISIGASATVLLILFFIPGVFATFDRFIMRK